MTHSMEIVAVIFWLLPMVFDLFIIWELHRGDVYLSQILDQQDSHDLIVLGMIAIVPIGGLILMSLWILTMISNLLNSLLLKDDDPEDFDDLI